MTCASRAECPVIGQKNALTHLPSSEASPSPEPRLLSHTPSSMPAAPGPSQRTNESYRTPRSADQRLISSTHSHLPAAPLAQHQDPAHHQDRSKSAGHSRVEDMFPDVLGVHCEFNSYHSSGLNSDTLDVQGRLRHNVQFWKYIGASNFILSIIANGYVIPFIQPLPAMFFRKNNSAMTEEVFVIDSILEVLRTKRIKEVTNPSYIVSPLSVVHQPSGKKAFNI